MGQKVNPHGLRVGVIKDWDAKWYAEDDFADNLVEDYNIRKFLKNKLYAAGISKIGIQDGMQKKISQTILLKMIKSENILKIVYTAQEFLEQKSNVLLIV